MPDFKSGVLAKAAATPVASHRLLLYIEACLRGEANPHRDAEMLVRREKIAPTQPRVSEMRRILKLSAQPECGAVLKRLERAQLSFAVLATVMIEIHRHFKQHDKPPSQKSLEGWIEVARARTLAGRRGGLVRSRFQSNRKPSAVRLAKEILDRLDTLQEFYGSRPGANHVGAARMAMQSYQRSAKKFTG